MANKKDYAYTPTDNVSDWKLDISDANHVSAAVAALGKGFRGNKVQIPADALAGVKRKVRAAYRKFYPDKEIPEVLKSKTITKKKYIQVTMEFEEYLTRWCGMYYCEAEVLARLLGFDSKEEEMQEEVDEMAMRQDWIDEKVANIAVIEKARTTGDYSELTPDAVLLIKETVDAYGEVKKSLTGRVLEAVEKYFGASKQKTISEPSKEDNIVSLPIIKSKDELKREITFVCYEPNVEDAHGEWATVETLKTACQDFNTALSEGKVFPNLFHAKDDAGKYMPTNSFSIVKSYVAEDDCIIGEQVVSEGTWLMKVKITSDSLWSAFLEGTVRGISIGCKGLIGD